jgi:transcriptional regulator with XRE-family HTH domain
MTECPGFGVVLGRLMERRGLGLSELAGQAGITEAGLRAVLGGAVPGQSRLRRLAPVLDMHEADLLAIAWEDVPDELAPLDWRAGGMSLYYLVAHAAQLGPWQVSELRERIRRMPQEPRPKLTPPPWETGRPNRPERTPSGMLVRLFANRNLATSAGYAIWGVSGRPLSGVTPASQGYRGAELTREELADYISVLDISAADMSIVTGVDLIDQVSDRPPGAAETARLIWDVRRLTAEQVREVYQTVRSYGEQSA